MKLIFRDMFVPISLLVLVGGTCVFIIMSFIFIDESITIDIPIDNKNKIFLLEKRITKQENELQNMRKAFSHLTISKELTISAYTPSHDETDSTPNITASMRKIKPGIVAISRDLFYKGWSFGKKVYINGYGIFEIQDLMNERYENSMDILMFKKKEAMAFGRKKAKVILIGRVE